MEDTALEDNIKVYLKQWGESELEPLIAWGVVLDYQSGRYVLRMECAPWGGVIVTPPENKLNT